MVVILLLFMGFIINLFDIMIASNMQKDFGIIKMKFGTLILLLSVSHFSFAMDLVRWNHGGKGKDNRRDYKVELLTQVLDKTKKLYGPYAIVESDEGRVTMRAIKELHEGKSINIFMAVTSPEWEKQTIPIRIPIRRGILNYRLLAINKNKLPLFSKLSQAHDLKKYIAGLRRGWATVSVMQSSNYSILQTTTLDGLYDMLSYQRIDYIPRGLNEIWDEISTHNVEHNNLVVEPSTVIYTQSPYYIFVSPKEKRLAKRIEHGLEMMIDDGSLKTLFDKYYADKIALAKIKDRKVIRIDNPFLSNKTPLDRKELWFEYDK